jgi:hypothetical protein
VAGLDLAAERGRDLPTVDAAHMQMHHLAVEGAVHRRGRAEIARREASELEAVILPRQIADGIMRTDAQLHHIGRARGDAEERRPGGQHFRHGLDGQVEIGDHARLAGLDHARLLALPADRHAPQHLDLAGAALAGAAVMRDLNPARERGI